MIQIVNNEFEYKDKIFQVKGFESVDKDSVSIITDKGSLLFYYSNIDNPKEEIESHLIGISKEKKYSEIDSRTGELISKGFVFDEKTFSLSANAQLNWSNILQLPESFFPLDIMTVEEDVFTLELKDRTEFYLSAVNAKNKHLKSGSGLKIAVKRLQTLKEVNEFTDTRL